MSNLDLISTVDIDISNPIVTENSYDTVLIVGPLPATGETPDEIATYSSLDDVEAAGWVSDGDGADPVGVAARVAFSQRHKPSKVYIAPVQTDSTALSAIKTAINTDGWYFVCTAGVDSSEYADISAYIETQEKHFVYTELTSLDGSLGTENVRTSGIYGKVTSDQETDDIPEENLYINVAFAVEWASYDSGSETAAFKVLKSVTPSELSQSEISQLVAANLNYFITVGGRNITMNGMTLGGEWCDVIRFRDWLKNDMQTRVVNLFIANPKIPYTDAGIGLVQGQMIASLKAGQNVGGIAETEYDENGDEIPGFSTSVPLASSLTDSEKASRKLTNCKFKARLAGAIHFAEITGSLTYTL